MTRASKAKNGMRQVCGRVFAGILISGLTLTPLVAAQPSGSPPRRTLTSVEQVVALTNAQAGVELPVLFQATVTYVRPSEKNLFVMDGKFGVYVSFAKEMGLVPGDRIEIKGRTGSSFRPMVRAAQVRWLFHGQMPLPKPAAFSDLIQSRWDSLYVQISGRVLSAVWDGVGRDANLRIKVDVLDGTLEAIIAHPGKLTPEALLDTKVQMRGVAGGAFDSKMQMAGVWLDIYSDQGITITQSAKVDPWSLPIVAPEKVVFGFRDTNASQRTHIAGTLTYFEPGYLAVVEQEGKAMLVKTGSRLQLHSGDGVEASGFPAIEGSVLLEDAQLRSVAQTLQVQPANIDWEQASVGHYAYNLVSMEGEVVGAVHDARVDLFVILSHGHLFSASVKRESADAREASLISALPTIGSWVRVTGVCFVDPGNYWKDRLWFEIRMRSDQDIVALQQPSWWTVKRLAYLVSSLGLAVLAAVIWVWLLERRLRSQAAVISQRSQEEASRERRLSRQEQQRSQILESISSTKPLPEVLREIQFMASSRLGGARCWFELSSNVGDLAEVAHRPEPADLSQELVSANGTHFGFLKVDLTAGDPVLEPDKSEGDEPANNPPVALSTFTRLAVLAIDTRRLYSDLRRRSEFDLLTDIPNRFSMERTLEELMEDARRNGTIFGLIYVDLDRFKQVNDQYGHQTGDLYLREVTCRMKQQLRGRDVLARIGGDEFIALTPMLRGRADAAEIAARLERCFDQPLKIENYVLHGSASVGLSIYPEDGETQEELQRNADEAMYANKERKREQDQIFEAMQRLATDVLR